MTVLISDFEEPLLWPCFSSSRPDIRFGRSFKYIHTCVDDINMRTGVQLQGTLEIMWTDPFILWMRKL